MGDVGNISKFSHKILCLPKCGRRNLKLFMVENANHARLIYIAASVVTAFYLHCTCILMAGSKSTTQQWTDQEIETLQYFIAHISEIGETGNFKRKTYTAAAETVSTHSDP